MDLNLYLGLPRSPPPRSLDLGSDLSLSSLPWSSTSAAAEDSRAPVPMSGAVDSSESHPPYSPSHAEYTPDVSSVRPSDRAGASEYTPYFPSFDRRGQSFPPIPHVVQDLEGHDAPYSPPSVQPAPAAQEADQTSAQDAVYDPASPPDFPADDALPFLLPYVSGSANLQDHEAATSSFYPSISMPTGEFMGLDDGPSSRADVPHHRPESCFGWPMEPNHRRPNRRFRSSFPHAGEEFSFGAPSLPNPEQPVHERPSECNGKHKVNAEDNAAEASEEEREDKSRNAANFECNICFDMASEPVVTSCGHLFCWPCLYQWLHIHSDHKECPVCKGEVTDSNITPIYGRGGSQPSIEKKQEDGESALKIPSRPHGNRFESFRQHYWPVSRRLGEGITASWRRFLDQHMRGGNRYEPYADPSLQDIYDNVHRRALIRLRSRRLQREVNPESGSVTGELGLPGSNMPSPIRSSTDSIFRDGVDLWHQFSMYGLGTDRVAAITADFGRVVGQFGGSSNGYGASTSSVDPPNPEPVASGPRVESALAADQVSASSTMAVIQGDVATSDALAEPNSVGSSRYSRRRARSSTSGSIDVDGGPLHSSKRRRLN